MLALETVIRRKPSTKLRLPLSCACRYTAAAVLNTHLMVPGHRITECVAVACQSNHAKKQQQQQQQQQHLHSPPWPLVQNTRTSRCTLWTNRHVLLRQHSKARAMSENRTTLASYRWTSMACTRTSRPCKSRMKSRLSSGTGAGGRTHTHTAYTQRTQ